MDFTVLFSSILNQAGFAHLLLIAAVVWLARSNSSLKSDNKELSDKLLALSVQTITSNNTVAAVLDKILDKVRGVK